MAERTCVVLLELTITAFSPFRTKFRSHSVFSFSSGNGENLPSLTPLITASNGLELLKKIQLVQKDNKSCSVHSFYRTLILILMKK